MNKSPLLIALVPLFLTACGGGGGSGGADSSSPSPSGQTPLQRNVADFSATLVAGRATTDTDLTGIWMEVSGDARTEEGTAEGRSLSSQSSDEIYRVHFLMDNGSSIDVSDCSTTLSLYTFHKDDNGNVVWSNFKGDPKPVGSVSNKNLIDFGTTDYSGARTNSQSDISYSGQFTSRWVKLSADLQDTIGTLSGAGMNRQIACSSFISSSGTLNGDDAESYAVLFRDSNADWLDTDSDSGNDAPVRSGKSFTLYANGTKVRFTLD